jgi:NOL1/NOP2/fmu family ribosome biogenesis protein
MSKSNERRGIIKKSNRKLNNISSILRQDRQRRRGLKISQGEEGIKGTRGSVESAFKAGPNQKHNASDGIAAGEPAIGHTEVRCPVTLG